jgi:hypothetical protein
MEQYHFVIVSAENFPVVMSLHSTQKTPPEYSARREKKY